MLCISVFSRGNLGPGSLVGNEGLGRGERELEREKAEDYILHTPLPLPFFPCRQVPLPLFSGWSRTHFCWFASDDEVDRQLMYVEEKNYNSITELVLMKAGQEFFPKQCEMCKTNANQGRPLKTGGRHYKFAPEGIGWALNEEFSTPQQLFVTGTIKFVARHLICVIKRTHNIAFKLVLRQCCKTNCSLLWSFVARFTVHTPESSCVSDLRV